MRPSRPRIAVLAAAAVLLASRVASAIVLPPGFEASNVFTGLTSPTAVRFAADGRVFVAEKSGIVKVFPSIASNTPTVFADLRTNVHNFWDRGLLGLALHPDFPTTPYVYVLYTLDAAPGETPPRWGTPGATFDGCPNPPGATTAGCVVGGRLSRLTAAGDVMTGSEDVLVENWCNQFPSHTIGSLAFGADGALYVSAGEGASFNGVDFGQFGSPLNPCGDPPVAAGGVQSPPTALGGALRAQNLGPTATGAASYAGKILRVDPLTGAALADNPLVGSPLPGADRIVAHGLRNPFRFTIRPGTNELWVGDVGWSDFEEIDRIAAPTVGVSNFGWPCFEGLGQQPSYAATGLDACNALYDAPGSTAAPFFSYDHQAQVDANDNCATGSSSISGMAFHGAGGYPAAYDGALFFADYSRHCIWTMHPDAGGEPDPATRAGFASAAGGPIDLQIGPGGDLYFVDLDSGAVRRVRYTATPAPTATILADRTSGLLPLTVSFDGSTSSDPQGGILAYSWDLNGDGIYGDATTPTAQFTYGTTATVTVGLQVTGPSGTGGTTVTIHAGRVPPNATISTPTGATLWRVGDVITFAGSATDQIDGPLPPSALEWSVVIHHCPSNCHLHFLENFPGVAGGSFDAPDHEFPSYLELVLTATNSAGLTDTQSVRLDPATVALGFESDPSGLMLGAAGTSAATPFTRTVIVGSNVTVAAPSPQVVAPDTHWFLEWSDLGAPSHTIVAPAADATYLATYLPAPPPLPPPWIDGDVGTVEIPGTASWLSYGGGTFTVRGAGDDIFQTADEFHFVHQSLVGDGEIVARVASQQNTSEYAKAGVMIREDLSPGSRYAFVPVTPLHGTGFERRTQPDAFASGTPGPAVTVPYWTRLLRAGNLFRAFASPDGASWTEIGSATIPMAASARIGLAVTSHDGSRLGQATFDQVTLSGGVATTTTSSSTSTSTSTSTSSTTSTSTSTSSSSTTSTTAPPPTTSTSTSTTTSTSTSSSTSTTSTSTSTSSTSSTSTSIPPSTTTSTTAPPTTTSTTLPPATCDICTAACCPDPQPLVLRAIRVGRGGSLRLRGTYTPTPGTFDPRAEAIGLRIAAGESVLRCAELPAGSWARTGRRRWGFRDRSSTHGLSSGRLRQTRAGVVRFDLRATRIDPAAASAGSVTLTLHAAGGCWRDATAAALAR